MQGLFRTFVLKHPLRLLNWPQVYVFNKAKYPKINTPFIFKVTLYLNTPAYLFKKSPQKYKASTTGQNLRKSLILLQIGGALYAQNNKWDPSRISRGETSRYLQVCIIRLDRAVIKKIRRFRKVISSRNFEHLKPLSSEILSAPKESVLSGIFCTGRVI